MLHVILTIGSCKQRQELRYGDEWCIAFGCAFCSSDQSDEDDGNTCGSSYYHSKASICRNKYKSARSPTDGACSSEGPVSPPDRCPECSHKLITFEGNTFCTNYNVCDFVFDIPTCDDSFQHKSHLQKGA